MNEKLDWKMLLNAYAQGYFPMAEKHDSPELHWFYPKKRGIVPFEKFHVPPRLETLIKKAPFLITFDHAFERVIKSCGEINDARKETWINAEIISLYTECFARGYAHSCECWEKDELVGGIYGVALGRAFFGESMFSRRPNASKIALVSLVRKLQSEGCALFDTQYINPHLKQFGAVEISRKEYLKRLEAALA